MSVHIAITLQEKYNFLKQELEGKSKRYYPFVISEGLLDEKEQILKQLKSELQDNLILAPTFASPKDLFLFIKSFPDSILLFEDEILTRRIEYIRVLEGAICSNPDSSKLWEVNYESEKSFTFYGGIVIVSRLKKSELKSRKQLKYILRDCIVI